jgi:hypothetical protein
VEDELERQFEAGIRMKNDGQRKKGLGAWATQRRYCRESAGFISKSLLMPQDTHRCRSYHAGYV